MPELSLLGLRVVQEVARRGSFTGAADALGYTQSAVSRQVAAMEGAAGAPLFERLPRGVRPTGAGRVLLRHAGPVLDRVDAAVLELGGLRERLEGRLAVGAFPTALGVLVPRALVRLGEAHPGIVVSLREGTSPAHLRRLRAGRIELAIIATGPDLPYDLDGLRSEVLLEGGLLVAVSAAHPFAGRGTVDREELEGETWIVGDASAGEPQFGVWPTLTRAPRVAHSIRDWPARLGLVAAGLGIALIPEMAADTMPPGIAPVAVTDPDAVRRSVLAVSLPERSPSAEALVRALREAGVSVRTSSS